jgi:hypothetical protein
VQVERQHAVVPGADPEDAESGNRSSTLPTSTRVPSSWSKTGQLSGASGGGSHSEAIERPVAIAAHEAGIADEERLEPSFRWGRY